jgi:hypothetical protein
MVSLRCDGAVDAAPKRASRAVMVVLIVNHWKMSYFRYSLQWLGKTTLWWLFLFVYRVNRVLHFLGYRRSLRSFVGGTI